MHATASTGRVGRGASGLRRLGWGVLTLGLLLFAPLLAAGEVVFEIVVPISTVVRAPEGTLTVLATVDTPSELIGETCAVSARSENQSSTHPGNDLIVDSAGSVVLEDVEAVPGGVVTVEGTIALDGTVTVTLLMGPDGVFSAGIDVLLDCPPEPTTTTTAVVTTTSAPPLTTTTVVSTSIPATTTTIGGTTTTVASVTTVAPSTTTTVAPATTTTIGDEVLAFTGAEEEGAARVAVTLIAVGVLILISERFGGPVLLGLNRYLGRRCLHCDLEPMFSTPHGKLCLTHTKRALDDDPRLWMPTRLR